MWERGYIRYCSTLGNFQPNLWLPDGDRQTATQTDTHTFMLSMAASNMSRMLLIATYTRLGLRRCTAAWHSSLTQMFPGATPEAIATSVAVHCWAPKERVSEVSRQLTLVGPTWTQPCEEREMPVKKAHHIPRSHSYVRTHSQNFQLNTVSLANVGLVHTRPIRSCVGKIYYITLASRMID